MSTCVFARFWNWVAPAALALVVMQSGLAFANNFEVYSGKSGCESIVLDDARRACEDVQRKKNDACNVKMTCELRDQEDDIKEYNAAIDKRNSINDSDRDRLEETIRDIKKRPDGRKAQAPEGIKIASECINRREDVQTWFADVAIPTTRRAGEEALKIRQSLLEKLADAQKRREEAKARRDADPNDDARKAEWEKAAQQARDVEKELEQFNYTYGNDIQRHVDRLVQKYVDGKTEHDDPFEQATNRLEKCQKVDALRY